MAANCFANGNERKRRISDGEKFRVGILGATGAVGQRFLELLSVSEWFKVTALGASEKSSGRLYGEVVKWKVSSSIPQEVGEMEIRRCAASLFQDDCDLIFSGLDSSVAGEVEREFADDGFPVFSNSKNHRMDPDVPILIPQINEDHLDLVKRQPCFAKSGGFIVTNANCASTGLCIALAPLHKRFGISRMFVSTLQAISGAGYPGLPSMDVMDNVVPFIDGEEEKLEEEPRKILGVMTQNGDLQFADIKTTALCHRVAVSDGHMISVSVDLSDKSKGPVEEAEVSELLASYLPPPDILQLPSCPRQTIKVFASSDRPQPRLDRLTGGGMTTCVGRIRKCGIFDIKCSILSHNTIVGAAGGSILNAELAIARGLLKRRVTHKSPKVLQA